MTEEGKPTPRSTARRRQFLRGLGAAALVGCGPTAGVDAGVDGAGIDAPGSDVPLPDDLDTATDAPSGARCLANVLDTDFDGLSFVDVADYGSSRDYRLDGTDAATAQRFTATEPQAFGGFWGATSHHQQVITGVGRFPGVTPSTLFTQELLRDAGRPIMRVTRHVDPYIQPDQSVMRLKVSAPIERQSMIGGRMQFRVGASWPSDQDGGMAVQECKLNGGDKKIEVALLRESGVFYLRLGVVRAGSGGFPFGPSGGGPYVDSVPRQDSFYADDYSANYYSRGWFVAGDAPPVMGRWWTLEWAFRLQADDGTVVGGAPGGWAWVATAEGTETERAPYGSCAQRFFVTGRNFADAFGGDTPGISHFFSAMHYVSFDCRDIPIDWANVGIFTEWPCDASSHPPEAV